MEGFCKKIVFKNYAKFIGKDLCRSPLLMKLQGRDMQLCYRKITTQFLYADFAKFLGTPISHTENGCFLFFFNIFRLFMKVLSITSINLIFYFCQKITSTFVCLLLWTLFSSCLFLWKFCRPRIVGELQLSLTW